MNTSKLTKHPFKNFKKKVFEDAIKTSSFIYQIGESEVLRKPSKEIPINKIILKEYREKFKYIKDCLKKYRKLTGKGRGITGVQVGIPQRFSVIFTADKKMLIIINPKITQVSNEKYKYPEMCMSANPIIAPVTRPAWIEFEYFDENGRLQKWNKKDDDKNGQMMNRVFQHEIDHMNGIINIDRCLSKELILESDPKFYNKAKFEKVND